jgi:hypothetical protein
MLYRVRGSNAYRPMVRGQTESIDKSLDVLICSFSCINSTTVRVKTQTIAIWCVRIRTAAPTPIGAVGGV